jgi:monoamine oxidase
MARTPLFTLVRKSLRLARLAEVTRRPADELVAELEQRASRRLDRRQLLRGAGGLAGLASVAPLVSACRTLAGPGGGAGAGELPVVVVGAGIAGLLCTYRLRQAGVAVRLVEAQQRTGGRMWSLRGRFPDAQVVEIGGELIDSGHHTMLGLVEELGLAVDDLAVEDPGIEQDRWWFAGARRSTAEVVEAFRPLAAAIDRDLEASGLASFDFESGLAEATAAGGGLPPGAAELDRLTLAEWLDRAGASGWIRTLLDVAYTTEYGLPIDRQSALNLLLMIGTDLSQPFAIFGESDERFHIRGGNDLVVSALAERVTPSLLLGHRLERLASRADGSFELALRQGGASRTLRASQVVLALPFTLLREVELAVELPPLQRRAIAELGYGTNSKLMIGFAARPWRERYQSNGSVLADLPFQLVWETSRKQAGRSGVLTNFTGGAAGLAIGKGTAKEHAARVVGELETVFPGIAAARGEAAVEVRMAWPEQPFVRGSYACYLPGQWTAFDGLLGQSVGGLHFAGEHCSREAQGFMEGGAETGEAAARRVLAALGAPVARRLRVGGDRVA